MSVLKVLRRYIVFGLFFNYASVFGGDCTFQNGTNPCKLITDCPIALQNLQKQVLPETCGFEGSTPKVCCPSEPEEKIVPTPGAKSLQKCIEYNDVNSSAARKKRELTDLHIDENVKSISAGTVVVIKLGDALRYHPFTHMAAIGYDDGNSSVIYLCGGSLISENFVISAAHCARTRDFGDAKRARLGDLNLKNSTDDVNVQELKIIEITIHPKYKAPSTYNDICLFRLEKDVLIGPHVRPICLQTRKDVNAEAVYTAGWGQTAELSAQSDDLLMVEIALITHEGCKTIFKNNSRRLKDGILDDLQICAGSTEAKDACKGDSGGPLQVKSKDFLLHHKLVGITSFGRNCGVPTTATVYSRISHNIEWIESLVWP